MPDHFDSWSEYENYVQLLVDLHSIDDAKKIWWDVRPHPTFGTLEFRVCDVPTRPETAVMLGALVQAIVVKLYRLRIRNLGFRLYRRALIEENKWRAARYGLDGKLIDFGKPRRSADARPGASSCSSSSTTSSTSWGAGGRWSTSTPCCARARAPTSSWRCSARRAI